MKTREDRFSDLDTAQLIERLKAAEDVCVLVGWTATSGSERGKALGELWNKWYDIAGPGACGRRQNPHLSDAVIAGLARKRDATREATLRHLSGDTAVIA